ncbi:hypothetical protein SLS58_008698 [Diplodia intermedia]|uniref:Major facilitator superfamily (MFS) profile domain-containing protein n=1 Tax=Diplodia intermedia TaxID=856260 RepID=A0ABR3TGV9_9PEZI
MLKQLFGKKAGADASAAAAPSTNNTVPTTQDGDINMSDAMPKNIEVNRQPKEGDVTAAGLEEAAVGENHMFHGVEEMEAITMTWSKPTLVLAYVMIFIVYFANSMMSEVSSSLLAYVTSSFGKHSLLTTTQVAASIIGGVSRLPVAKIIDVWGRPEGFLLMLLIATIGLILMAVCQNVETYAAAAVFYRVGYNGMGYVLDVFIADTSSLRNRALMFAFSSTPFIATAFAGPAAAQKFLEHSSWRWGYATFAIVIPIVSLPMVVLFIMQRNKARARGLTKKATSNRTWAESFKYYFIEFDVVGLVLLIAGWTLVLLPLTLATYQANKWRSGMIIAMIIIGGLCLIGFVVWERYFAPVSFIPFHVLTDRTVMFACILSGVLFVASSCWSSYFQSFLQVVSYQTVSEAGYIGSIYSIGACIWAVPVGFLVRHTNRFKWLALIAAPLMILSGGLMIKYRQPHVRIQLIIMCQVLMTLAGGTLVVCEQMAVMAAAEHTNVAVCLALLALFTNLGSGIGSGVSGAIWTNTFPRLLREAMPEAPLKKIRQIYASLVVQKSFPRGSVTREAVNWAYGVAERRMCIAATAILVLTVPCVVMWRDYNVKEVRRTRGRTA